MNKEKIIIIGCGEHAQMVIDNVEEQDMYEIFGLTTNNEEELQMKIYGYSVVCKDDGIEELLYENADIKGYILGVGSMVLRYKLYTWLDTLLTAVNIIHPASTVSRHAQIGRGNLVEAYTKIANSAQLGNHCIINSFSAVNHDQVIGDNVLIAGNVSMAGKSIGDNTIIADGASIGFKKRVGKNCIVGDGSGVTKDIPDNVIVYGNPAKIVRENVRSG